MADDSKRLTHAALFQAFFIAGLSGFGAVLPFARRMMVERKGWLTATEFADLFSLCQFLPGSNVVNLATAFGSRHRGLTGALVATAGLLIAPVIIVIGLGLLYEHYGTLPIVHRGLGGLASAASGLVLGTALKIAGPVFRHIATIFVLAFAFVLFGVLHLRLPMVIAIALPVSLAISAGRVR
ncbi:MAG: chromate transporter [Acidiphilium sp.]|nr:chromate transporter [Acidiphilium sp.]MDD4934286.1 chromate transporter [Acidiphilium sp.]